ncbi:MAG: asparaginase [Hyphomicrobiaceae bacterium]
MTNPVVAEVWRGGIVESHHRGAISVAGPGGSIMLSLGDVATDVYPRSAIKIFQALPLVESGAADAFGFGDASLALACASHNGEVRHANAAREMLAACGLDHGALECGAHRPMGPDASWELAWSHGEPTALHNNCSGKHAGMAATAVHLGEDPAGYVRPDHPVQQRVRGVLEEMTGAELKSRPCGVDGCSVPTWAFSLAEMALGLSRLATGEGPGAAHADAGARLLAACFAEPEMTSGAGRCCAQIIRASGKRAYVKVGAEGVYCGVVPDLGVGIALKIDDGGKRAAEVAIAAVVSALLPDAADALEPFRNVTLTNWRSIETGVLRPSSEFSSALGAIR